MLAAPTVHAASLHWCMAKNMILGLLLVFTFCLVPHNLLLEPWD